MGAVLVENGVSVQRLVDLVIDNTIAIRFKCDRCGMS